MFAQKKKENQKQLFIIIILQAGLNLFSAPYSPRSSPHCSPVSSDHEPGSDVERAVEVLRPFPLLAVSTLSPFLSSSSWKSRTLPFWNELLPLKESTWVCQVWANGVARPALAQWERLPVTKCLCLPWSTERSRTERVVDGYRQVQVLGPGSSCLFWALTAPFILLLYHILPCLSLGNRENNILIAS